MNFACLKVLLKKALGMRGFYMLSFLKLEYKAFRLDFLSAFLFYIHLLLLIRLDMLYRLCLLLNMPKFEM